MPRHVAIAVGDLVVRARLFDELAPRAAARLWSALPIEALLRQSRWSGETTFAAVPALASPDLQAARVAPPRELPATFMCPGRLYFAPALGGLGLPYGQAQSRDLGRNTWLVEIGAIEDDPAPLLARLAEIARTGPLPLRVTRARSREAPPSAARVSEAIP